MSFWKQIFRNDNQTKIPGGKKNNDSLLITVPKFSNGKITKESLLSCVASIYDPSALISIIHTCIYTHAHIYKHFLLFEVSQFWQTSMMERFVKIDNNFSKSYPLTIFEKSSIIDIWTGSKYSSQNPQESFIKNGALKYFSKFTGKTWGLQIYYYCILLLWRRYFRLYYYCILLQWHMYFWLLLFSELWLTFYCIIVPLPWLSNSVVQLKWNSLPSCLIDVEAHLNWLWLGNVWLTKFPRGFGHICWINPRWKTSFFVQWL